MSQAEQPVYAFSYSVGVSFRLRDPYTSFCRVFKPRPQSLIGLVCLFVPRALSDLQVM